MKEKKSVSFLRIFIVAYLAYSAIYIARLNFSVASTLFESAGKMNKAQIGIIGGTFSFAYAISKVPNGYFGDLISPKKIILTGLIITAISNILIGVYSEFWNIVIMWGLNAFGQSMLWGAMLRVCAEFCPDNKFKQYSSVLVSSVAVGSIAGLVTATICAAAFGVEACFIIPGIVAITAAALVYFFFPDKYTLTQSLSTGLCAAVVSIFNNRNFRRIIIPAMSHGIIKDNINVWLALYCVNAYGINPESVAGYIFFVPVFALIGRFLYPLVYRVIKNDYYISSISFLLCAAAVVPLCIGNIPIAAAMGCLGAISALVSIINTHFLSVFPAEFAKSGNLSFASSLMDLITYGGAGIGAMLFGMLIQRFGYESMFMTWGVVSCISILFLMSANKRRDEGTV